jgi:hypothetical protein
MAAQLGFFLTTRGTLGSMRKADELSITTGPSWQPPHRGREGTFRSSRTERQDNRCWAGKRRAIVS